MTRLATIGSLFLVNVTWRLTNLRPVGRIIVHALGSRDENIRAIAGMFLVRAGKQAQPLLEEALRRRENLPVVLIILGDINAKELAPEIQQFSRDQDPGVARAARDALRILSAH